MFRRGDRVSKTQWKGATPLPDAKFVMGVWTKAKLAEASRLKREVLVSSNLTTPTNLKWAGMC